MASFRLPSLALTFLQFENDVLRGDVECLSCLVFSELSGSVPSDTHLGAVPSHYCFKYFFSFSFSSQYSHYMFIIPFLVLSRFLDILFFCGERGWFFLQGFLGGSFFSSLFSFGEVSAEISSGSELLSSAISSQPTSPSKAFSFLPQCS